MFNFTGAQRMFPAVATKKQYSALEAAEQNEDDRNRNDSKYCQRLVVRLKVDEKWFCNLGLTGFDDVK